MPRLHDSLNRTDWWGNPSRSSPPRKCTNEHHQPEDAVGEQSHAGEKANSAVRNEEVENDDSSGEHKIKDRQKEQEPTVLLQEHASSMGGVDTVNERRRSPI